MKRRQREALCQGCTGDCAEARALAADLEASGEALDRYGEEIRRLQAELALAESIRWGGVVP